MFNSGADRLISWPTAPMPPVPWVVSDTWPAVMRLLSSALPRMLLLLDRRTVPVVCVSMMPMSWPTLLASDRFRPVLSRTSLTCRRPSWTTLNSSSFEVMS
ncbi:hypothetical protein D3C73_1188790 [compost metagenome]